MIAACFKPVISTECHRLVTAKNLLQFQDPVPLQRPKLQAAPSPYNLLADTGRSVYHSTPAGHHHINYRKHLGQIGPGQVATRPLAAKNGVRSAGGWGQSTVPA